MYLYTERERERARERDRERGSERERAHSYECALAYRPRERHPAVENILGYGCKAEGAWCLRHATSNHEIALVR